MLYMHSNIATRGTSSHFWFCAIKQVRCAVADRTQVSAVRARKCEPCLRVKMRAASSALEPRHAQTQCQWPWGLLQGVVR